LDKCFLAQKLTLLHRKSSARQKSMELMARMRAEAHLLPEAGATQERTLEAVRCKPWFGPDAGLSRELCAGQREICILVCGVITPWSLMLSNFTRIQGRGT